VVFFGNNPDGRSAISHQVPGDIVLGFPGVGGVLRDGTAEYVRIRQQPAALAAGSRPRLDELAHALGTRGFAVQRVADMDGWLAYHAAFVACVAAALYRCGTDPSSLAADRATLSLMCAAVTEAFAALEADALNPFGSIQNRTLHAALAGMDLMLAARQNVTEGQQAADELATATAPAPSTTTRSRPASTASSRCASRCHRPPPITEPAESHVC
jgi:ketopantoate reductase